ncbi:hypothetical protein [Hallella seregens]|uniref:Uncharacterized protein n=1 Tax=Hallella seregens ATCC 51272 TaxID=1336250 RepID=A0ABV5ZH26_9BACT|nr:hypothetical protein [Hallella seregens]
MLDESSTKHGLSHKNGFQHLLKAIFLPVQRFVLGRKPFFCRFSVSPRGESHLFVGSAFRPWAKAIFMPVQRFVLGQKPFFCRFSVSSLGESHFCSLSAMQGQPPRVPTTAHGNHCEWQTNGTKNRGALNP